MFRCPKCGQARRMTIREGELYQPMTMDKTYKLIEGKAPVLVTEFDFINNFAVIKCHACDEGSPSVDWKDAWDNPMKIFDADNLCHCGGELWMDQVPNTPHYAFICEKCDWVKPKSTVSGAV